MNDKSINSMSDYIETNCSGTLNLARQAVKSGVKRFIFISTIKVNGEKTTKGSPFRYDDLRMVQILIVFQNRGPNRLDKYC